MIDLRWQALLGAALMLPGNFSRADDPPTKPDPSGYRTVQEAATRVIVPPRAGRPGETGFLGVATVRDAMGRLVVEEVQPDSPALNAGIAKGDVVDRVEGEAIRTPERFREWLQARGPGEVVKLGLIRGDQAVECSATLVATSRPRVMNAQRAYLGLTLGPAKEGEGVLVEQVQPDSPALAAGFKAGDRIFQVEGLEFANPGRLSEILVEKKPGDEFEVSVRRGSEDIVLRPRLVADQGNARPGPGGTGGRPGQGGRGQGPMTIPLWTNPEFRLAVVAIEYPDVKHDPKMTVAGWEAAVLGEGSTAEKKDPAKESVPGSLNDYFTEQSAGKFKLKGKVFEWIEVGKKRAEYILGSGTTNITAVLTEALEKVAARDGKEAFNDFDGFLFVYAGEAVRGNRGGVYSPHAGMIRNFQGKRWPYVLIPEGGPRPTPIGGMVKEFALMLGLPDLAARPENRGSEGLGPWSTLSNPARGSQPQHLDPWAKEKLGWLKPTVIDPTVPQKLALGPIEGSAVECFKVLVRPDGSEYYLLENRRKRGFDQGLPGEGLLIWRVVRDRPILIESHGVEGPAGPTSHLDAVPYPSPANHAFTPETSPSSRSPLGGGLPVSITNIRRLEDGRIGFQLGYDYR